MGFWDLVAYGLAYIAPVAPLTTLGLVWSASAGMIGLAYVVAAVCMAFTAHSYAVLSREQASAGSVYAYAGAALGPWPGFLAGWMVLLDYLLIPALTLVLMALALDTAIPGPGRLAWLLILVAATLGVNVLGMRVSSRVNQISVLLQALVLIVMAGASLWVLHQGAGSGGLSLAPFVPQGPTWPEALSAGAGLCVLSFLGFDAISTLGEEVRAGSEREVARATLAVLGIIALCFIAMAWVLGNLMIGFTPQQDALAIFELAEARFGAWVVTPLTVVLVLVAGFTNLLPMQAGVARVLFAMGRDGKLPVALARVHPRRGTPHVALVAAALGSLGLGAIFVDHVAWLTGIVAFGALSAFAFAHLSVLTRLKSASGRRQWLAHGLLPALGLGVVLAILTHLEARAQHVGLAWLLAGLLVHQLGPGRRSAAAASQ